METKKTKEKKVESKKDVKTHPLILGTRVTEKSAIGADKGAYTFNVKDTANKSEIKKAIKAMYNVTPVRISITKVASKKVVRRGLIGTKAGGKKATIYLKKGDKITFA